jgi:hypothetical protein
VLKLVQDLLLPKELCTLLGGHHTRLWSRSRSRTGKHPGLKERRHRERREGCLNEAASRWRRRSRVELELLRCRKLRLWQTSVTVQLSKASREEGEYLLLNLGLLLHL